MYNSQDYLLKDIDPEIYEQVISEEERQEEHIELIASENYTSPAVMAAQGSQLTNKYAEGYIGKRFYGGCEFVDQVEQLAIDRIKKLYGAEYANVQPHSGSQANQAVYFAFLKPGDTIMGMNLGHGGHLTHGSPANLSGKLFNIVPYGLNDKEEIDYDHMEELAIENKPKLIIGGASAYALTFDWERMSNIAKKVGAYFMVDMAHYSGLIAGGVYPNPTPYADFVTSTTHKSLRGPRGGFILAKEEHGKALNSMVFPGIQGGPLMHVIAAKAVAFLEALKPSFKEYQQHVVKNAQAMAQQFIRRGYRVISGRTESHVFLVDLRAQKLTGKEADRLLGEAHITVNKNSIPNDPESPFVTSGIRIGTPAITTRGLKEKDAIEVVNFIADILDHPGNEEISLKVKAQVSEMMKKFPVYKR
ncbi:MAG: serine hydroxymethyltransferase [Methylophilaceae bacterium]|nr:serine hydroxymethyltransferase [Methylophilaceae bacterium]